MAVVFSANPGRYHGITSFLSPGCIFQFFSLQWIRNHISSLHVFGYVKFWPTNRI